MYLEQVMDQGPLVMKKLVAYMGKRDTGQNRMNLLKRLRILVS